MLLAELEVWHTRPAVPTRRISLGHLVLPVEPPPGFGGLLLGAVAAAHARDLDDDLLLDVHRLVDQVGRGERIVQPRLRHRFQVDRHGLSHSVHRMIGDGDDLEFAFETTGTGLAQVLGAVYALERLDLDVRRSLAPVLHAGLRWRGPIGPALVAHLAGGQALALTQLAGGSPHPHHRPLVSRPTSPSLLLFPGAGSSASHPSLLAVEAAVAPRPCVRADFPYRRAGRRAPDRAPILMAAVRDELTGFGRRRVVMGGRSMGGRICSMVAAGADGLAPPTSVVGLVLIAYPLHPPGRPDRLRTEHLPAIEVPCLFVSGTRDAFGTPDELRAATELIPAPVEHVWIDGGTHDLRGADERVAAAVAEFVSGLGARRPAAGPRG